LISDGIRNKLVTNSAERLDNTWKTQYYSKNTKF